MYIRNTRLSFPINKMTCLSCYYSNNNNKTSNDCSHRGIMQHASPTGPDWATPSSISFRAGRLPLSAAIPPTEPMPNAPVHEGALWCPVSNKVRPLCCLSSSGSTVLSLCYPMRTTVPSTHMAVTLREPCRACARKKAKKRTQEREVEEKERRTGT